MIENKCPFCGKICKSKPGIARHIRICKENPDFDEEFYNKYYLHPKKEIWNKGLTKETDDRVKQYGITLSKNYKNGKNIPYNKGIKYSKEFCDKVSNGRKKYLLEHPDEHPWKRNDKFISKPCEHLKELLKQNNISFEEEYSPLKDRNFSIDIVFLDKKIGIEINGNQHYDSNGKLNQYYQERHDLIEQNGWKLYEIHYAYVYKDDIIDKIKTILEIN